MYRQVIPNGSREIPLAIRNVTILEYLLSHCESFGFADEIVTGLPYMVLASAASMAVIFDKFTVLIDVALGNIR